MLTTIDWMLVIGAWSLILWVLILELFMGRRMRKVYEKTRVDIEKDLKEILGDRYDPVRHRVPTYEEDMRRFR